MPYHLATPQRQTRLSGPFPAQKTRFGPARDNRKSIAIGEVTSQFAGAGYGMGNFGFWILDFGFRGNAFAMSVLAPIWWRDGGVLNPAFPANRCAAEPIGQPLLRADNSIQNPK